MSKKDLAKPRPRRQPTDREISSFVQGGTGQDTAGQDTAGQDTAGQDTARLTVDLPRETHRRFKAACAIAGTKMNDEIRRFIERRSVELGISQ